MQLLFVIFVAICLAAVLFVAGSQSLRPYLSRGCQGVHWHRAFPDVNTTDIRSFLNIFGNAFCFSDRHALKFSPTDKVMQIYHARNPGGGVDALELESFAVALQRHYNFNLQRALHSSLTLGELFAQVRGSAS